MDPINPPLIGKNIQRIRKSQGMTLNVLSEKSGVSKAMLSQIESDKVNPTVATVWKIAQGLNVEINSLLEGTAEPHRKFKVSRKDDHTILDTDEEGLHIRVLTPMSMAEDLEMYLLTFQEEGKLPSSPHFPQTIEFLTVFQGEVKVTAGENVTELRPGDFLRYHSDIDHTIENIGSGKAVVHLVVRFSKQQWG